MNITIEENATQKLINEYAQHRAAWKMTQERMDAGLFDEEYTEMHEDIMDSMYHQGFCECAEQWMERAGINPKSPIIEQKIMECMK